MRLRRCNIRHEATRKNPYRATWIDGTGKRRFRDFESMRKAQVFAKAKNQEMSTGLGALTDAETLLILHLRRQNIDPTSLINNEHRPCQESPSTADAVEMFLADCKRRNLRPRTQRNAALFANSFTRDTAHNTISEITSDDIGAWITGKYLSEVSRRTALTYLRMFFSFCRSNSWIPWDTIDRITWSKGKQDKAAIHFLRASQVRDFLYAVQDNLQPAFALAFFAGIRTEELCRAESDNSDGRLYWSDVDFEQKTITIRAAVAKTRKARTLYNLPENLWAWLPVGLSGPVMPMNPRNMRAARKRAYVSIGMDKWPHNVARHSFATHGYWRGYEWAVSIMGHTGGPELFYRHYRGHVSEQDADDYFTITPKT